jgi:hypothetical protein
MFGTSNFVLLEFIKTSEMWKILILLFSFGRFRVQILTRKPVVLTVILHEFPKPLQASAGIISRVTDSVVKYITHTYIHMYKKQAHVRASLFWGCCADTGLKKFKFTLLDGSRALRISEWTLVVRTFR